MTVAQNWLEQTTDAFGAPYGLAKCCAKSGTGGKPLVFIVSGGEQLIDRAEESQEL